MKITAYEVRPDEKDYLLAAAQQEQIEITLVQGPMTQDNIDRAEGADGITILGDTKMDAALIEETAKRRIRVVATRTIGYDHIDLNAAKSNGVHVCNGYYDPDGVAEYTVMLILMSLRNYKQALFRGNANDYSLGGLIGRELRNLTVGIIGTGKIARILIRILKGFGMNILAYDLHPDQRFAEEAGITYTTLDDLYARSDIISLHCPLTPETEHLINTDSIGKMKDGVMIINTGRGKLINTEMLIDGLKSKKVGSAGLDVYEEEGEYFYEDKSDRIIDDDTLARLLSFNNVILTSHQGFFTKEALHNIAEVTLHNIRDFLESKPLINRVSLQSR